MTNSKNTKRALTYSVLALFLCVAMLIGTTFAWFTDTASTGVNRIQAGNLKMDVSYKNTTDGTFRTVGENTNVFMQDALWEPGHVEFAVLKVENVGSLALKYKLGINIASEKGSTNVNGDEFKLSDYINFAVVDGDQSGLGRDALVAAAGAAGSKLINAGYSGEGQLLPQKTAEGEKEKIVTLVVWMPETVGNEANHAVGADAPEINLGINVVATQAQYESDSFDNTYDKDAAYNATVVASDDEFEAALTQARETKDMTIMLKKGTYGSIDVPVLKQGEKLSGLTIVAENGVTIDAFRIVSSADYLTVENLTLKNLNFVGEGFLDRTPTDGLSVIGCTFKGAKAQFKTQIEPKKNVRIENCYFDNTGSANTFSSIYFEKGVQNLIVKGTTIKNSGFNAISLQSDNADVRSGGTITIENNTMTDISDRVIRMNGVAADAYVTIKGNTMTNNKGEWFKASLVQNGAVVKSTGNTLNGSSISDSEITSTSSNITF